jgi:hypothetical protein
MIPFVHRFKNSVIIVKNIRKSDYCGEYGAPATTSSPRKRASGKYKRKAVYHPIHAGSIFLPFCLNVARVEGFHFAKTGNE